MDTKAKSGRLEMRGRSGTRQTGQRLRRCALTLASPEPPGVRGTMIRTGRSGKLWEAASVEKSATNPASSHLVMSLLRTRFRAAQFTYSMLRHTMPVPQRRISPPW
jgi:hypothetical protein